MPTERAVGAAGGFGLEHHQADPGSRMNRREFRRLLARRDADELPRDPGAFLGSWVSFLSLGVHLRHPVYVAAGIFYATTVVVALWLNVASNDEGTGSDLAGVVLICAWVASAAHAYVIRRSVRIELDLQSER